MRRTLLAMGFGLFLGGCGPVEKPAPVAPEPVTITVPSGGTPIDPAKPPAPASDPIGKFGKWTHTLPGPDGEDRTVILEYLKDQDGRERFEFVQHHWPQKPVFVEQTKNGDQSELKFKIVSSADESEAMPRTLKYVLKDEAGKWVGKLFESWTETPYDVVLTRSQ